MKIFKNFKNIKINYFLKIKKKFFFQMQTRSQTIFSNNINKSYPTNNSIKSKIPLKIPIKNTCVYKKKKIPKKIKEEVWIRYFDKKYESKCYIDWCSNKVDVFNFQVGHNIPESKGGTLNLNNLKPICDRCNYSMGANYTIDEWNKITTTNINFKSKNNFKDKLIVNLFKLLTYFGFQLLFLFLFFYFKKLYQLIVYYLFSS